MSKKLEGNAHSQSRDGQPLQSKRRQVPQRVPQTAAEVTWVTVTPLYGDRPVPRLVTSWRHTGRGTQEDSLEGGHSVPLSGTVKRTPRLSVSDLPPLHGPPLKVTPPWQLSPEKPRAASARLKLPPLPAAPEASGRRPRAQSRGLVASRYHELVPPSLWGSMAADRAQETPSPDSTDERAWQGSAARHGHRLPPLRHVGGVELRTGTQPAWKLRGDTETEDLTEVKEAHGDKTSRGMFRDLALYLKEDTFIKSTCTQEHSRLFREADAEPQVLPTTPTVTAGSTGKTGNFSELLSPVLIAESCSTSDSSRPRDISLKEPEEKWEEEELPDPEATGDRDSDPRSVSLSPLKEENAEAVARAMDRNPCNEGPNELFPTSEAEEALGFSASSSSGGTCEEMGTRWPAEQRTHSTLLCTETEDASKPLLHIKAEELEQLEEDILTSLAQESPSHSHCSLSKDCAGKTETYSQLVSPDLFEELWCLFNNKDMPFWDTQVNELLEKWEDEELPDRDAAGGKDSERECGLCPDLQDVDADPASSPLESDPSYKGHSERLLRAPGEEAKMSAHVWPANPLEEANEAYMDADHAQASNAQEKPCGTGAPAGTSLVSAQHLACSVPSSSTDMTLVPRVPPPRQWRFIIKTARRALRRLFSFSCLRGQSED